MAHETHDHSRSGKKALFIAFGGSGVGLTILERLQIIIYANVLSAAITLFYWTGKIRTKARKSKIVISEKGTYCAHGLVFYQNRSDE